jgi:uncharacterized membrane protein YgcG
LHRELKKSMSNNKKRTIMKKMMMTLIAMLTMTVSANAMSFEQARNEALFLTDKMAYELNLTDEQYEAAYEINLDYLMGVTGRSDVFGVYWERRNLDLSYILYDWQWQAYIAASYFYRPLYWEAGYWHFGIYARYPHRDYFYFGRPAFYATYRGGHAWHIHGDHGYYYGRREHFRAPRDRHVGMHDRWDRGDFRNHRNSSTRVTGGPGRNRMENGRNRTEPGRNRMENGRSNRRVERQPNAPSRNNNNAGPSRPANGNREAGTPSRTPNANSTPSRNSSSNSGAFSGNRSTSHSSTAAPRSSTAAPRSSSAPSRNSSAAPRSSSAPTRTVSSHSSAGSSHSSASPSRSGGSSHSSGGGSRGGGGGHFGGRR